MSNIREIIIGRLSEQLADVFGQIDKIRPPKRDPSLWVEADQADDDADRSRLRESILDAWAIGKSLKEIALQCGTTPGTAQGIIRQARYNGDARSIYRGGWAAGKAPSKLKMVPKDEP
jgi:DNA-binding NarL/FixJ family response regulator